MTSNPPHPKLIKTMQKPQWPGTADQAVRNMGGNVSPLARQALDAIYGTEIQRQLDDLVDSTNELIASNNRQIQELHDQTNAIAELEERVDETRDMSLELAQEFDVLIESQAQLLKMSKFL